jgi:uncharacterized membrane-anchored protein YjiN (DUF445 family)
LLVKTLTHRSKSALEKIKGTLEKRLRETKYKFKVEYNDETITAHGYVSKMMDALKSGVDAFSKSYGKQEMRNGFERLLFDVCERLMEEVYWKEYTVDQFAMYCANKGNSHLFTSHITA